MAHVSLHVPESVPRKFLNMASEQKLINIVVMPEDEASYALFDRATASTESECACRTRDNLAVRERTVTVTKNHHQALSFPCYALPEDCKEEETHVIVAWLLRNKFKSFRTRIMRYGEDKKKTTLLRTLETNCWFEIKQHPNGCCDLFTLVKIPIFFLKHIVLSPKQRSSSAGTQNKVTMNNPDYAHALRYAVEHTKLYLMDRYKEKFKHYFENAVLETRPATDKDYFVPPSLASKCVVVVKTRFDEIGCKRLGCFTFKKNAAVCDEKDPLQWVRIGDDYVMACQESCKDHSIDSEWSSETNTCILSNPLKKAFATMPESIFERASRHVFHGGFDVVHGRLKINERYCKAYGLDFKRGDCYATGAQKAGEWLFGKTIFRATKADRLKPVVDSPPGSFPGYMTYTVKKTNNQALSPSSKKKRTKRSTNVGAAIKQQLANPQLYKELAVEVSKDIGREITERAVINFLKHKAPKVLTKTVDKIAAKLVIRHTLATTAKSVGVSFLKGLAKGSSVVLGVYAFYELISGIIDIFDPFDFLKVIDKKQLREINTELDYTYYQDGPVRPELTPEYVFDHEILEDDENDGRVEYMIDRVEEYLNALKAMPPTEYYAATQMALKSKPKDQQQQQQNQFVWLEKGKNINDTIFKSIVVLLVFLTLLCLNWIHVWACCLFFLMLFYSSSLTSFTSG